MTRALPDDEWRGLRVLTLVLGAALLLLAASGVMAKELFHQPSATKYAVTVLGAGTLCVLATVRMPLRVLVGAVILAAPFNFVMTFSGAQITPLLAAEMIALVLALPREVAGRASVRWMGAAFTLLLIPAVVASDNVGHWTVWLVVTVLAGWLIFVYAREPKGAEFVVTMLVLSGALQALLALYEFKTGRQLNLYTTAGTTAEAGNAFFRFGNLFRPSGALADPIGLGQMLALCLPFAVVLGTKLAGGWRVLAALAGAAIIALSLLLSLSRMSIVGGGAGAILALTLLPGRHRVRALIGVAGVVAAVVVVAFSLAGNGLGKRLGSIISPTATNVSTAQGDLLRQRIWQAAEATAADQPVTGVGFGNITKYLPLHGVPIAAAAHAHDTYLQFLAEAGVLGLLAVLGLMAAAARDLLRAFARERILVAGALGALLATLIAWSTDVEVRYQQTSALVAILIGLAGALSARAVAARSPSLP